jgi:Protein of unknown function (DUF2505)
MRICIEQPIAASAQEAQAAFLDPAFYASLGQLEGISAPELRSLETAAGRAKAVVGYRFSGQLSGPAATILDPAKLTWAQVSDVDLAGRRTEFRMVADNYVNLLSFSGWYELRDDGKGRCVQHFDADLVVHLVLLGPLAERALAGSVRKNIDDTAHLVERYAATLRSRPD